MRGLGGLAMRHRDTGCLIVYRMFYRMVCLLAFLALGQAPAWAQRVMPVSGASSTYTLTTGGTVLQVGTADGGRIASLKYQGTELLRTKSMVSGNDLLWGSTLWPSPQAYWTATCKTATNNTCWPPPVALDPNAYTGGLLASDTALSYTGGSDSYTGLRFRKTFWADSRDSVFTNRYHLINTTGAAINWAPWETTRFPSGGMAFWPTGDGPVTGNAAMVQRTRDTLGVTWFTYDSAMTLSGNTKIYADGGPAGWMARIDKNRILFLKKFTDSPVAKKAPATENEIEIYVTRDLLEFEVQGPYNPIPARDSIAWEVQWLVRKLPDNVPIGRNAAMVAFVNQLIAGATTSLAERCDCALPKDKAKVKAQTKALAKALRQPGYVPNLFHRHGLPGRNIQGRALDEKGLHLQVSQ